MTEASQQHGLPDLPWGKVAGVAGGVAATWLAFRGALALSRLAYHEVRDRALAGSWPARRG